MNSSKTITDQLEELIKRAKSLKINEPSSIHIEDNGENNGINKVTDLYSLELKLLDKRLEMCTIQKNAIKGLIKTHKEELELLESALRSILEEEKKIQGIILRESPENDIFSRATSMELVEKDNNSVVDDNNSNFKNVVKPDTIYNEESNFIDNYEYNLEARGHSSSGNQSDYSEEENSTYDNSYYSRESNNFDRKVRFSIEELEHVEPEYNKNSARKSRNQIRTTITIPRRFNYLRNKNSSLLKDISIKNILDGGRKPSPDERHVERKELVRQLHNIYGSRK
ncbi:hypothetical protein FG379_000549 [Cryptosporidium bovis]|uniref:uncharacterized protein n=1 Tax=Cryptosporidium bovis TaxID=310047 RepID=UPI00351AAE55|nr:hypothetical protein FG379_000549 [Cryptosporidium bovis]